MNYKEEVEKIKSAVDKNAAFTLDMQEVVLYGAGALGRMAMDIFSRTDICPAHIADKKAEGAIGGLKIERLSELSEETKQNALFLVTICTISYSDIESELQKEGIKHIMPFYTYAYMVFPKWLSNGWFLKNISADAEEKILEICGILEHDAFSLHHYMQFCWWKLKGQEVVYEKYPVLSGQKYFSAPCMPTLNQKEFLIDCGCYEGGTIQSFIKKSNACFDKVLAFEPDLKNLSIAKECIQDERVIFDERAVASKTGQTGFVPELGFASKLAVDGEEKVHTVALDDLGLKPSIIKIHVEGGELNVLRGALHTVRESRPMIMVFADHTEEGLWEIPAFVRELSEYRLYFYLHDYCGNSAVFYMIPNERTRGERE